MNTSDNATTVAMQAARAWSDSYANHADDPVKFGAGVGSVFAASLQAVREAVAPHLAPRCTVADTKLSDGSSGSPCCVCCATAAEELAANKQLLADLAMRIGNLMMAAGGAIQGLDRYIHSDFTLGREDPEKRATLAALVDVCRVLESTAQGRKALADFCDQPVFHQAK